MRGLRWDYETHESKKWEIRDGESQADYEARMYEAGLLPGADETPWCDR